MLVGRESVGLDMAGADAPPAGRDGRLRRVIPFVGDGVATGAALCASSAEPHVLYENGETMAWAEGERAVIEAHADVVRVSVDGRHSELPVTDGPLATVGEALRTTGRAGWRAYGWVAYELSTASADGPVAWFVLPRREIRLTPGMATLEADTEDELGELEHRLAQAAVGVRPVPAGRVDVDAHGHGAHAYVEAVDAAVRAIRAGELDKVILSRVVPVARDIDLAATYLAGRRANDPARSFLLRLGGWEAAGFSPEIVARVTAGGTVVTQPLAGTRALDGDPEADAARREELCRNPKEVYEHAVSVRLAADELTGFCAPGTVRVTSFMSVKERGSVQHLASELAGELRPDADAWDALAGLFPAVTASGIPKAEAGELLRRLEPGERGLYSGAVVTADADGSLDAALVLRSVFRRDGKTWLRAGAGIVAQSTPERELEETREKLASVSRHLVPAADVERPVAS